MSVDFLFCFGLFGFFFLSVPDFDNFLLLLLILHYHRGSRNMDGSAFQGELRKDMQNTPASALSGGQRSRVALAAVSFLKPHVLVLDEPTNNLDLEAVAALADSVKKFAGAVICVSHDQFFVGQVANEAWVVSGGKVKPVASFEAYREEQLKELEKTTITTSVKEF